MPKARSRDDSMVVRAPIGPSQCTTKRTFVMEKSAGIMSIAQGVSDSTARWAVLQYVRGKLRVAFSATFMTYNQKPNPSFSASLRKRQSSLGSTIRKKAVGLSVAKRHGLFWCIT